MMTTERIRRAIRCTCSYCRRDTYFNAAVEIRLEAISGSTCAKCGRSGAAITLDIEPPDDAVIQDRVPRVERHVS